MCAPSHSDYISWVEFPVRIVLFLILAVSDVSSGSFLSRRIFYSIFSQYYFVFRFHVTKSHAIFRTILHRRYLLDVAYKKLSRIEKKPSQDKHPFSLLRNMQWHDCLGFSISMIYPKRVKFGRSHQYTSFIFCD